jgi:hypothetical protein
MPIETDKSKQLRATRTIGFNSPFESTLSNVTNKSQSIVSKQGISNDILFSPNVASRPFPGTITPPLDSEGKAFQKNSDGKFIPIENTPANELTEQQINYLTNNGNDTDALYTQGLDALVEQKYPGTNADSFSNLPITSTIIQSASGGFNNTPTDSGASYDLENAVTDQSRMVGQQLWNYKVSLFNFSQPMYELRAHLIKELVIEDDLLTWPLRGYIIIDNREEGFERSYIDKYYHIRSDARDEIHLEIWPTVKNGTLPDKIWKINTTCVIYDVEDLPSQNNATKIKKMYFWDKKFQVLFEKNLQWSTATTKTRKWTPEVPEPIAHATDEERSMWTGDALLSILKEAGVPCDEDMWDRGLSKINYVAKADWTMWENILYILQYHVSEVNNDNCLITWNRADKKLNFLPYYKVFEKAGKGSPGELQLEHFFFEEITESTKNAQVVSPYKAPYNNDASTEIDIKIEDYNKILNYRFSQTAGTDSARAFTTAPVHSHWHKKKQFDIDVEENEIEFVKNNYFLNNYVSNLMGNDYPVLVLNLTKKNHESTHPIFISRSAGPQFENAKARSVGRSQIMFGGIFFNQCLVLRVQGSTHRLSNTFVGVDRLNQDSDTNYDYALCGQYFVVNVKHIMKQQKYINELVLVKVHAYKPLKNNEGVW